MPLLMFHDDGCGVFLDKDGICPVCGYHPDTQSTGFKELPTKKLALALREGSTFMGQYRTPIERLSDDASMGDSEG